MSYNPINNPKKGDRWRCDHTIIEVINPENCRIGEFEAVLISDNYRKIGTEYIWTIGLYSKWEYLGNFSKSTQFDALWQRLK